jgi:hypothetical protein
MMASIVKLLLALGCTFVFGASACGQSIIARWNFEGVTTTNTGSDVIVSAGSAAADSGALTTGSLFSAHHDSAATVWSNPAGNGSAKSVSSNTWKVGDYYQFRFSTIHYEGIGITWDQTGSNTGPRDFKVQYSIDGSSFTDAAGTNSAYQLTNDAWSSSTTTTNSRRTLDLSGVSELINQSLVYIRFVQNSTTSINGGTVASGGTGRIDNITIRGDFSTGVDDATSEPRAFLLERNYPNPFNPTTTIGFNLPTQSIVSIAVYNLMGQKVAEPLANRLIGAGRHTINFDASHIPSGVYFYRITAQGYSAIRTMMLMR